MIKTYLSFCVFLLFIILTGPSVQAQEFLAEVKVNAPTLTINTRNTINDLEKKIQEFINRTKWTDDDFEEAERIHCSFHFNITKEIGTNSFVANVSIKASRPVYASGYETPIMAIVDKEVPVNFDQYAPLEKTQDNFNDNLSSFISFYLYIILGLDYDSFGEKSGTPYFETAWKVVNSLPPSVAKGDPGWAIGSKRYTRYWLAENYLSPKFNAFRTGFYKYHRLGLDLMSEDVSKGRAGILEGLNGIRTTGKLYLNAYGVQVFTNTKKDEIIDIFLPAPFEERNEVYKIMTKLDPTNSYKYQALISN